MLEKVENQNARNWLNCKNNLETLEPIIEKYNNLYEESYKKVCEGEENPNITDEEFSTLLENYEEISAKRMALLSVKDAYETLIKQMDEMEETFVYLQENLRQLKGVC